MDAGSRERQCEPVGVSASCVPGCIATEHPSWCDPSASDQWCGGAAWRPQDLSSMLAQQKSYNYNELVLDAVGVADLSNRPSTNVQCSNEPCPGCCRPLTHWLHSAAPLPSESVALFVLSGRRRGWRRCLGR